MNRSNVIKNYLLSTIGVIIVLVIMVAVNTLSYFTNVSGDFTEEKLFTLADGTRNILADLPGTVTIRFYYTRDMDDDPEMVQIANFARHVQDLLEEYEAAGHGKLRLEIYNPSPDTDAEDAAVTDGLRPRQLPSGDRFYLGLTVTYQQQTLQMPIITQAQQMRLEYDISRMIANVTRKERPTVGLMSSFDLFGDSPDNPMTALGKAEEWGIVTELRREHNVVKVPLNATVIPDEIQVLVVVHPKRITPASVYAIDQYLMRGGNLIAFVDPVCSWDALKDPSAKFDPRPPGQSSLEPLFKSWGVRFDPTKVVADDSRKFVVKTTPHITVLNLIREDVNPDDVVTAGLNILYIVRGGSFTAQPVSGLQVTPMIHSTENSMLVESSRLILGVSPRVLSEDFRADGVQKDIAIRVVGNFPTAFPEGPPPLDAKPDALGAPIQAPPVIPRTIPQPGADPEPVDPEAEMSEAEMAAESDAAVESEYDGGDETGMGGDMERQMAHLVQAQKPGSAILVADADMLDNDFWFQRTSDSGGFRVISHNAVFLLNAVSQLSGNSDLISIRSKGIDRRPFTVIDQKLREAQERTREKELELEYELREARARMGEIQMVGEDEILLTPEQEAELRNLEKTAVAINEQVREIKKDQRREINRIENNLQRINIALIPFLIVHLGLILLVLRRGREQNR